MDAPRIFVWIEAHAQEDIRESLTEYATKSHAKRRKQTYQISIDPPLEQLTFE